MRQKTYVAIMKTRGLAVAICLALIPCLHAESFTTNIVDGIATNAGPQLTVGATGPYNFLLVTNGGRLTNGTTIVGDAAGAHHNTAVVTDPNSVWHTVSSFILGNTGALNQVWVLNGARLRSATINVGVASSSNRLDVLNAVLTDGYPNAAGMGIGVRSNANFNVVTFDGPSARGTNDRTFVGLGGAANSLVVRNGAEFTVGGASAAPQFVIGATASSDGNSVEILGEGSKLTASLPLELGDAGSDNRLLVDSAYLRSFAAQIGGTCGSSNNSVLVRGPTAVWTNGNLELGFCSVGNSLTIAEGAQVLAGRVASSIQGGGRNVIDVSGEGSLLRATDLVVGVSGVSNALLVTGGANVASRHDQIGGSGWDNLALVSGAGSGWSNVTLVVGDSGSRNSLRIDEGASAQSGELTLGRLGASSGNSIEVIGPDSRLFVVTNLNIGGFGDANRLLVADGANAFSRNIHVGGSSLPLPGTTSLSHFNRLSIIGTNSRVVTGSNIVIGFKGSSNRLEVLDGADIDTVRAAIIGDDSGAGSSAIITGNSAIVSGRGSRWTITNDLVVGYRAWGSSLVVSNGGFVRSHSGYLGTVGSIIGEGSRCPYPASFSSVHVTGHDSIWAMADSLVVGGNAVHNRLLITNGGRVAAQNVIIGLGDGGVTADPDCRVGEAGLSFLNELEIAGGDLRIGNFGPDLLEVRYGTLRLRSGAVNAGELRMTNRWSRLELLGGSLFCIQTVVDNGLPLIIGDGLHNARFQGRDITAPGGVVIREHATLISDGRVTANVTNAGTLSLFPFAIMAIASNYVQQPAGNLLIDIGIERSGALIVSNVAVLNGSLLLRRSADIPSNTNVSTLRAAAVSGTFNNVTNGGRLKTTDNLGSFMVEYTATSVILRDYRPTDLDGDMIEDAWATQHFGHSPLTPAEKAADDDGDGSSNYDEFIAGTDPKSSASTLRASISYTNGGVTVAFPCQEGKRYSISWSSDLITWNHVIDPTFSFPEAGVCRWTDDGQWTGGVGGPARFFRVSVE
jgi:T5SS/PEP-CTERM-associated repeat protein